MDTSTPEIEWDLTDDFSEQENHAVSLVQALQKKDFGDDADDHDVFLVYTGAGPFGEMADLPDDTPEEIKQRQVTAWTLKYPSEGTLKIARSEEGLDGAEAVSLEGPKELYRGRFYVRPGYPTRTLLSAGVLWCQGFQAGQIRASNEGRDRLRKELLDLIRMTTQNMPAIQVAPIEEAQKDLDDEDYTPDKVSVKGQVGERLEEAEAKLSEGWTAYHGTLTVEIDDEPSPTLPDTPEHAPSPFQGDGETAHILSGPFSSAVTRSLIETPNEGGRHAEDFLQQWGADSTGHPIRVEELRGQYGGRVTFRVQAYGEPDPTAVDAEVGWAMLQGMNMGTVWLHALLLAHASAPGRRGERNVIRLPRSRVEKLLGFGSRNKTKWERAEAIQSHMDQLRSVFVQFQNVERHGDKLRFRHDMSATPLWNIRMVAQGERDLFTGRELADWHMEAREGLWAEEFLHNHGDQWAPLPKEWFEQIDRRGNDWAERLAILLIFLFRTNRQKGGRVTLSAQRMLETCGVDLKADRSKDDRYNLKQKLSRALDDLAHNYGIRVQDEDVNISKIEGRSYWTGWKNQTAIFDPPEKIDRALLSGEGPQRPPLPEVRPGRWSGRQIKRLLSRLGWTQKKLAKHLSVSKGAVSHYVNGRRAPGDDVREALDRLQARCS